MTSNSFREQVRRNNLLDAYSNVVDSIYIEKLKNTRIIETCLTYTCFCIVSIKLSAVNSEISFKINNQLLMKINDTSDRFVNIKLKKGDKIVLTGDGDGVLVQITGAKFKHTIVSKIMPQVNKKIIFNTSANVYGLTDESFASGVLTYDGDVNCIFAQTYKSGNEYYIGALRLNNGLYFCNNSDNYATQTLLDNGTNTTDAIFVRKSTGDMNVVYLNSDGVQVKSFDSNLSSIGQVGIVTMSSRLPLVLVASETYIDSPRIFAVISEGEYIDVFRCENYANIQKIAEFKGKNIKIIEKNNRVIFLVIKDYMVEYIECTVDYTSQNSNVLEVVSRETIDNIVDCEEYNGSLKFVGAGLGVWLKDME